MNSMNNAGLSNREPTNKEYTSEPNEIQKSIDQIGLDAVVGIIRPHGNLEFCDMHGYYALEYPGITDEPTSTVVTCPMCLKHNPKAEGTPASEVELFIDLRDSLNAATTIID